MESSSPHLDDDPGYPRSEGSRVNEVRVARAPFVTIVGLVIVALGLGMYAWYETHRFVVTVGHEGPEYTATDVALSLGHQHASTKELRRGKTWSPKLTPQGESGLELRFKLGDEQCLHRDGYVESAPGYHLWIEIRGCKDVRSGYGPWPFGPRDLDREVPEEPIPARLQRRPDGAI